MITGRLLILGLALGGYIIAQPILMSPDPTVQAVLRYGPTIGALTKFSALHKQLAFSGRWTSGDQNPFANTRVSFGQGDVCCPGIPSRQSTNIATGQPLKN